FELSEFEVLDSHLDSFRLFIRRREVSDYHRTNFSNVIRFTRRLIALAAHQTSERNQFLKDLQQEEVLTERTWLLAKLAKL
ncbi:MAG: hypothetical protein AB8H12_10430, partial [Lewinella sp.]